MAQQGSYAELSQDPNSAFSRLMEWQMSGGETKGEPNMEDNTEAEAKETLGGYEDVVAGLAEEEGEGEGVGEAEEDEEALKEKSSDEAGPQTVLDKSEKGIN